MIATQEQIEVPVVLNTLRRLTAWLDSEPDVAAKITCLGISGSSATCHMATLADLRALFAGHEAERKGDAVYEQITVRTDGFLFVASESKDARPQATPEKVTL